MPLSNRRILAFEPKCRRFTVADGHGLGIEVLPSGTKSWRFEYRMDGRHAVIGLGRYPDVSLAQARATHSKLAAAIREGVSPAELRRIERKAKEGSATVEAFVIRYMRERVHKLRKDPKCVQRYFDREILPIIGEKPIASIDVAELREIIFRKRDGDCTRRGCEQAALAIRNLLKRLWDYAMVCGVVDRNPLHGIQAKFVGTTSSRTRALNRAELSIFLRSLDQSSMRNDLKIAARLILLTLVRKRELIQARWEEISLERAQWEIPDSRSKTKAGQIVYLSRQACELLKSIKRQRVGVVFPMRDATETPMNAMTLNLALKRLPIKIEHFTVHDLRRTAATNLAELEYPSDWIEKALNHKIKGVRGIYNRAQFAAQRIRMLQDWADWLDQVEDSGLQGTYSITTA